ncbi:MAG: hypothetical protein QME79_14880 [Bacillota bacterium]|nr:hypothetical protein [Bacillota bacterium]
MNDGKVSPVGYCSPWELCPDCGGVRLLPNREPCQRCGDTGLVRRENPCPGHATPEEARAHYKEYLLDYARYDGTIARAKYPCEVCGEYTDRFAQTYHGGLHILCDAHRNREGLAQVLVVGDMISSS